MRELIKDNKTGILFLVTSLLILALQSQLIIKDPIIEYDDISILEPLQRGVYPWTKTYYTEILEGKVVDVQPIRDLSLTFDVLIKKMTGYGVHHLHNCLIWIFTGAIFFNVLILLNVNWKICSTFYLLFSLNPVLWNAVSWISARKHLLSALLISYATFEVVKFLKNRQSSLPVLKINTLYLLSCFSQPINVGWPAFAFFLLLTDTKIQNKKVLLKKVLPPFFIISLFTVLINFYYYYKIYPHFSDYPKFLNQGENDISLQILSIGRYYFQTFLSFWPTPTPYYTGDFKNFIGIGIFVLFFYVIYKLKNSSLYAWGALSILPLITVTYKMTNIFGFDTYLIVTILSSYTCLAIIINSSQFRQSKFLFLILTLVLIIFVNLSSKISDAFKNNKAVFNFAYSQEPTPFNLQVLAKSYIEEGKFDEAVGLARQLINWAPYQLNADEIFSKIIYFSKNLSRNQKMKIFLETIYAHPELVWTKYFLACLELEDDNFHKSLEIIMSIKTEYYGEFGTALPKIIAHFLEICRRANADCSKLGYQINFARKFKKWNESIFIEQSKLYKASN